MGSLMQKLLLLCFSCGAAFGLYSAKKPAEPLLQPIVERGHSLESDQLNPLYNSPGRINLKDGWNFWLNGSFIYWQALEEKLDPARTYISSSDDYAGTKDQKYYAMKFKFKPGFKVEMGKSFDCDGWELLARYTWLHLKDRAAYHLTPSYAVETPFFYWPGVYATDAQISVKWHLKMDLLDLEMKKAFYVGTNLIVKPFAGLKGGWIHQQYNDDMTAYAAALNTFYPYYHGKVRSWKVGARAGLDFSWLFSPDFRLQANTALNLLYSHYRASYSQYNLFITEYTFTGLKKKNLVQPAFESAFGFGWGSYFNNQRWHLDLSALYEFQVFLKENQFLLENFIYKSVFKRGGLYTHGLTASLKVDF
ncbi:MAG: Lpg1974 family pore-forming outer membrane protein [Parachlamydiales bacterium]|jgi:hypothetical protein